MDALTAMRQAREALKLAIETSYSESTNETFGAAIAALDAAIEQVEAAESTGLRLVPCEPNLGMQAAGCSAIYEASAGDLEATGMEVAEAYRAMLAAAPPAADRPLTQAWVPVSERLPKPNSGEVLVWLTGGRCAFDEWITHHEDPLGMSTVYTVDMGEMWRDYEFDEITHWMPLPVAPADRIGITGETA